MSNPQVQREPNADDATMIENLSELRKAVYLVIETMNGLLANKPSCIAEMTLSKRELQSARHWLGECLSYYPTGYRVTDNPKDPGSESKAA